MELCIPFEQIKENVIRFSITSKNVSWKQMKVLNYYYIIYQWYDNMQVHGKMTIAY